MQSMDWEKVSGYAAAAKDRYVFIVRNVIRGEDRYAVILHDDSHILVTNDKQKAWGVFWEKCKERRAPGWNAKSRRS